MFLYLECITYKLRHGKSLKLQDDWKFTDYFVLFLYGNNTFIKYSKQLIMVKLIPLLLFYKYN